MAAKKNILNDLEDGLELWHALENAGLREFVALKWYALENAEDAGLKEFVALKWYALENAEDAGLKEFVLLK
ncbi:hypothetical protein KY285_023160 [Solanum tuberosum]|nr:hypothetical protein KY285_023160 [Solanum tuberosum]